MILFLFFLSVNALASPIPLIYSNDVHGEIEPCGCRGIPQGGFLRKLELIKKRTAGLDKLIQSDSGDLFFSSDKIPPALEKQAVLQAQYVVKAMNQLKHTVFLPGEKDFALGTRVFDKLRKLAKFEFVASNLFRKNGSL